MTLSRNLQCLDGSSLNNGHVGDNLVMLPPVPLPLDGLVEEGAEDDEEEAVEDA